MKAVIIDDDTESISHLSEILTRYCSNVKLVGSAINSPDGAALILEQKPDLVFLDIKMPNESGFDMLTSLGNYSFEVIFITGYDGYAIQAIKCSALDYLQKPIIVPDLLNAVSKAEKKINRESLQLRIDNLTNFLKHPNQHIRNIAIPISKGHRLINPDEIIYLKASRNYTSFIMKNEEILISKGIYHFEELLKPFGLIRCHGSFIVNIQYVSQFHKEQTGYGLLLFNGVDIPVTSLYLAPIRQVLGLEKSYIIKNA